MKNLILGTALALALTSTAAFAASTNSASIAGAASGGEIYGSDQTSTGHTFGAAGAETSEWNLSADVTGKIKGDGGKANGTGAVSVSGQQGNSYAVGTKSSSSFEGFSGGFAGGFTGTGFGDFVE